MTNKQLMELLEQKEELGLLELNPINPKKITDQNKNRIVKDNEDGTYYLVSNVLSQSEADEYLKVQMASSLKEMNKNVRILTGITVVSLIVSLTSFILTLIL